MVNHGHLLASPDLASNIVLIIDLDFAAGGKEIS